MEYAYLRHLVREEFTIREIAGVSGKSATTVAYWLKKFGLKTKHLERRYPRRTERKCIRCGTTDETAFYGSRWNHCKICDDNRTRERAKGNRAFALELLGGVCRWPLCGFNLSTPEVLDIHHKDASLKDPSFKAMRHWSQDRIRKELETCILLCKNHHALEHARLRATIV